MNIITIKTYEFDELSDEAKAHAVTTLYDINVDYDWWESVYEDAEAIGFKINGFDIDRGAYVSGKLVNGLAESVEAILKEHGEGTETYTLAQEYKKKIWTTANADEDRLEELEEQYIAELSELYLLMLRNEYEYQTSEEAVIETIHANEYQFLDNGSQSYSI